MNEQQVRTSARTVTMGDVQQAIEGQRLALLEHTFLARLETSDRRAELDALLKGLGFFVFAFQDLLRAACRCSTQALVAGHLEQLCREDRGHELWYLRDLRNLGLDVSFEWAVSHAHAEVRDISYELIAKVISATDDRVRLSVLFSLEAAAQCFFERVESFAKRTGVEQQLYYFGRPHREAEEGHDFHGHTAQSELSALPVNEELHGHVLSAVESTFVLMGRLADHLEASMRAA